MKRSLRRALWAGAVVALAVAAVPMATASAAGSVTATFAKVAGLGDRSRDEGDRHQRHQRHASTPGASSSTCPSGTTISSFWDADVTSSGNHYVAVKKSWAGPLAPGASFSWGYNGTGAVRRRR